MFDPYQMRVQLMENLKNATDAELKQLYETIQYNIRQNFCPNCGTQFKLPDNFCSCCGGRREPYTQWFH